MPLLKKYETIVIVKTELSQEAQKKFRERFLALVDKHGGREIRFEVWGKRKLAYSIKNNSKGIYYCIVYLSDNKFVSEFTRVLKITDYVLRFMTVNLLDNVDPETYDFEREKGEEDPFARIAEEQEVVEQEKFHGWDSEYADYEPGFDSGDDYAGREENGGGSRNKEEK
ncbi:MAG: 30S ribosomal protein S6 [Deltaproteobacteria bacterium]|nr:30S ribosomal protein S6 [Deltaproteobacteria bacterium]